MCLQCATNYLLQKQCQTSNNSLYTRLGGSFRISIPDDNLGVVDSYDPGVTYYIAGKHNPNELSTFDYIAITYFQAFQMAVRNVIHHS